MTSVAVIGAGNVGCALAADLSLRGVDVRLYNRSAARLEAIRAAGGITATGEVDGYAPLQRLTTSLPEAVDGADVVAVALPTATLPTYARELLAATTDDQLIWLDPGHSGGALYLSTVAADLAVGTRTFCQLTTASHVSRMTSAAAVHVFLVPRSAVAALPARRVDACHAALDALLPGRFQVAETVLENDLANINAVLHPPGMVCNAGWIEASRGGFGFYTDGVRGAVSAVMEALDRERLALAAALHVRAIPFAALFAELGFVRGGSTPASIRDAVEQSDLIHPIRSPPSLDHRYLHEDVGWGLVPWLHLGRAIGCPTPTIAAVVHLAGAINHVDYTVEGHTLRQMGLDGPSAEQIRAAMP